MRRLRVVMAFERVGHGLPDAMPGGDATQESASIIGYSAAHNPDQFRIY